MQKKHNIPDNFEKQIEGLMKRVEDYEEENDRLIGDLLEIKKQYEILLEKTLTAVYIIQDNAFVYVNTKFAEVFDYTVEEILQNKTIEDLISPNDLNLALGNIESRIKGEVDSLSYEMKAVKKDGTEIDVMVLGTRVIQRGKPAIIGTLMDVTKKNALHSQLLVASKVFENVIEGIVMTDETGNIEWANPAFTYITGYDIEEVKGKKTSILKSNRHDHDFYKDMWDCLLTKGEWQGEIWNRRKNGEAYPQLMTITSIRDKQGEVISYLSVFSELTQLKKNEAYIEYQANYDLLTDLPNRALYHDRLKMALAHVNKSQAYLAVLFLDLDDFKKVNDGLGHAVGDVLLKEVAKRLKEHTPEDCTIARMGGDEFTFILPEIYEEEEATEVAQNLLSSFEVPFEINKYRIYVTASLGISIYPFDGDGIMKLMKNAESAMYRAKESLGSYYEMYTPTMNQRAMDKITLENELRYAIDNDELRIYFQPKVDIINNKIIGVEALVRWQHPKRGMVSPGDFIPIAEQTGLIVPLGEWVLKEACLLQKRWQSEGLGPIIISVNLSAVQFKLQNLAEVVKGIVKETGIEPSCLDLEITETTAMASGDYTIKVMEELKHMGINLSIDDFGTGYSSLSYLKKFPCDFLKIDKSFIDDITDPMSRGTLVNGIIAMAHSLGIEVVAEGVETLEQWRYLRDHKCDQVQGYFYSPPLPSDRIKNILKDSDNMMMKPFKMED